MPLLNPIMKVITLVIALLLTAFHVNAEKPNILFIAVDDLRPELNCYGARSITPNIDRLAATGLRFDRAYCQQAVCGASRTSLMMGLYPEATEESTFHVDGWRKRWPDVITMNQHFRANNYTTIGMGKIYHGRSGPGVDPDNWTRWIKVNGKGYANPESMNNLREKVSSTPDKKVVSRGPVTESADVEDDVYTDGATATEGARQIKRLAKQKNPFFLAVGFTKPHLPFNAPTRYWDLYERDSFSLPDNLSYPPGYPIWAARQNSGEIGAYSDMPEGLIPSEYPMDLNKRLLHGYHACVSYTDRNIGVLLDALEQAGVADNTIIVLWGDHGWKLGDHSGWCKHTNFECDARVPLLVRHPKLDGATGSTNALVELIDLYPTLCELCGIDTPPHVQGKSFVAVLQNPKAKHHDFAYSSYPHTIPKVKTAVIGHSIRNQRYRYTEWWEKKTDKLVERVLTDLIADPGEETNLLPEQKKLANQLSKELKKRVLAARESNI
jgi:arylsulfatase A-like enzyme